MMLDKRVVRKIIRSAFDEDICSGDITTAAILTGQEKGVAEALTKSEIVVAGIEVFREAFLCLDERTDCAAHFGDGQTAITGEILARVSGSLHSILSAERVALNFFQRMCGIATSTKKFVDEIKGTQAKILDTRKTVPGLRYLDKYAVKAGGGSNHRFGLYDGILIKDNHIASAGGISVALSRVRSAVPHTLKIEIEVKNMVELEEALSARADVIMLDNMSVEDMKAAVSFVNGRVRLEASGNVTLGNVRKIAETGVDFISVGMLTHSVSAADISLNIDSTGG
jgi:nicotinate-nucleotide pyrophosphorylase (carboxylating)